MYSYNFEKNKYWITLDENTSKQNINLKLSENDNQDTVNYYSSTGQFISNCFFFVEGIDSVPVKEKIQVVLNTLKNKKVTKDINHLENQDFISTYIFKYIIQNNQCDKKVILEYLNYLIEISIYLANKIGCIVEESNFKIIKKDEIGITRCSYKFCHYTYYCQYNYPEKNTKTNKGCYSDHYVHNKVAQDLYFLIDHIQTNYKNSSQIILRNNQEVIKCINTITFCIKHMYDELWNIYISSTDNYENYHKNMLTL